MPALATTAGSPTWPAVLVALIGALFFALGAALQQYEAAGTADAGSLGRLRRLLRRPRWLAGGAALAGGTGLHVVALGMGPLTVVQPIGAASLLFAMPIAAVMHGRRARAGELAAAAAVGAGLIVLVLRVPEQSGPPRLSDVQALWLLAGAAAAAAVCWAGARRAAPAVRAALAAGAAGALFAVTSTLARVVAEAAGRDPSHLLHWFALAAFVPAVLGLVLLQNAYSSGRFGLAFAAVQISDPLAAVAIGGLLLGDPLPSGSPLVALAAAALICAGITTLARTSPETRQATPAEPRQGALL